MSPFYNVVPPCYTLVYKPISCIYIYIMIYHDISSISPSYWNYKMLQDKLANYGAPPKVSVSWGLRSCHGTFSVHDVGWHRMHRIHLAADGLLEAPKTHGFQYVVNQNHGL